mgnify:CR=1 FL=1
MTHQKNLQLCPDSNSDLKWSKIDLLSIFDGRLAELWNELVKNGELIGKAENQGKSKFNLIQKFNSNDLIQKFNSNDLIQKPT